VKPAYAAWSHHYAGFMTETSHTFTTELWHPESMAKWVFVTVPKELSEDIREVPRPFRRGFGSIRVQVTIGATTWSTSIFPDADTGCYVLPVKKAVRDAEGVDLGDEVEVSLEVLD
jgi:hypothetical protein